MPPKHFGPSFKGKNKLFRHEVHNIRLGVGQTIIGKHTIRLLIDRLTAEETKKYADSTQSNAESVLHLEANDLALTYGSREFLVLKRKLEPLCLTTAITLHYHQSIAKMLLHALYDHIEADGYFAVLNLTMAFARDTGTLFIPYFDLFSKALLRGLYDKETGTRFIAKTDRVQLTFTALSALVNGIGGAVSKCLTATAGSTTEAEDMSYEASFVPTIPKNLNEEQLHMLSSMRRVIALVVQRTFRDTKEYIRRLGAETIAALCRRHPRLVPIAFEVCTQAATMEVQAARAKPSNVSLVGAEASEAESETDEADEEPSEDESEDDDSKGDDSEDEEDEPQPSDSRPLNNAELKRSAVADSMLYLTQNLLTGIKGVLATNFENSLTSILAALTQPRSPTAESDISDSNHMSYTTSQHVIATFVLAGTVTALIEAVRNDKTNTSIPRILTAVVDLLLPPALMHLEAELDVSQTHSERQGHTNNVETDLATGHVSRCMRVILAGISAAHYVVLNKAHEAAELKSSLDSVTSAILEILRRARSLMKPKAPAPKHLPQLFTETLAMAQGLVHTDKFTSQTSVKAAEGFVASLLAESGRMLQGVCATSNKTHILTVAHTVRDYFQDISQKSVARLGQFSTRAHVDGALTMPCNDEFAIVASVILTAKAANGQLEASFRRELMDTIMLLADIARSTLPSATASAAAGTSPHMLVRVAAAAVPGMDKKAATVGAIMLSWMRGDLAQAVAEVENAHTNEEQFLTHLSRAAAWMNLLPSIDVSASKEFTSCVTALGSMLASGQTHSHSAKLRNRILQVYVRGSALISRDSGSTSSKLGVLIKQVAHSIPAGFHTPARQTGLARHPQSADDLASSDTTVALLLESFDSLRASVEKRNEDHSFWIDSCIDPSTYDDFLFVLMHSLASTRSSSTRLSVITMLRDCYDYQHRMAGTKGFNDPSFAVATSTLMKASDATAIQTMLANDHAVFDLLVRCEQTDPLTEGLDAKTNILAPIMFDAANTSNYFERYGGKSESFMMQVLARFFFGCVYVKFSPMWTVAVRVISNLVKLELTRGEPNTSELGLWRNLVQPLVVGAVLGNEESATRHSEATTGMQDNSSVTAIVTQSLYTLAFDDSQVHASGALVSHNLKQRTADDVRSRPVHALGNGQRLLLGDVGFGVTNSGTHAVGQSTDPTSVARVLLNTLVAVADSIHLCKVTAGKVLSFPEQLVIRLSESDVGIIHEERDDHGLGLSLPSTTSTKSLNQRLEIAILAMSAQYSLNTQALAAAGASTDAMTRRRSILEAILLQHVCSKESRLQAAAVEGLRKMGVAPFATYHEFLFPVCGGKLSVADMTGNKKMKKGGAVDGAPKRLGTANAKSALTFLQSFNLETSIKEEHRVSYLTTLFLLCLPTLTATGKAGSGGQSHKKSRDREVLGRKLFALLSRVRGDGQTDPLAMVVDLLMERILRLPPGDSSDRYDLCGHLVDGKHTVPKLRRRYEQLNKRLVSALKLLQSLIPAVGTRFLEYSETCFTLLLHMYELSLPSVVAQRAGLVNVKLPNESGSSIRKIVVTLVKGLIDTYPDQIGAYVIADARRTNLMLATLESIYSHAPQLTSSGARGGTTAPVPPPIELAMSLTRSVTLMPLLVASAESFVIPSIERYFRQSASDSIVLAVLSIVGSIVGHADERLQAVHMNTSFVATTLRKGFLEPYGITVFNALHRFVTNTSEAVLTEVPAAKKDRTTSHNPMRVSPKIWKDVVLLASALPEYIRGGNVSSEVLDTNMAQLLEIALNFARSPVCATDRASADMAADTIEAIVRHAPKIHPTTHFRKLVHLFNVVTAPVARTVLCSALKIAVTKIEGLTDLATMLQLQAVARGVACMNAFAQDDEAKVGSKRHREGDDTEAADHDATDYSRYDFELRYHTFHSITQFLNKECGDKKPSTSAVGKATKALAGTRSERKFVGEQDIEIPITVEQPRLAMESAVLIAVNLLFYLRDRERTIRTFAGESLHALIRYAGQYPCFTNAEAAAPADSDTPNADSADPLNQLVRPVLLPAFRRGIVSKDTNARLEYMKGFGALAQYMPVQFPSLALLYSPNSEANFFSCIASAQHRVRMNALSFLRKKCGQMHQREVLRVFVPFVVTYLKDFAQGKHDARSEQVSEAKQKGFAEGLLLTLAAISAHMPWEGYHRILSLLLKEAQEHDALRAVMLKGIVKVLESFHFLEVDETGQKRIIEKVAVWEDDEESTVAAIEGGETADLNDPSAALATAVLAPSARAERKNIRIMGILEEEVLPQLYSFILAQKKGSRTKDLEGVLNESNKESRGDKRSETKASVQLPVAVGILKIIRLFPQKRFDHHVDILLNEIVIKLRTKNDKQRETARTVLFAMMNEAGPQKLRFVVTKLRDNLVHGYQLHVLGYTLVGLLQSMFGYAGEQATVEQAAPAEQAEVDEAAAEDDSSSEDDEDDAKEAKGTDEGHMTTENANSSAPSKPTQVHKPILPHTAADEQRIIGKAFRMGGTRRRIFSPLESTAALDAVMSDLFDVFIDDYLGEVGEQKEQTELISTLREVKHNKSLQGFSFLAMHCSGDRVMDMFVTKIRFVLAPPTTLELLKNSTNSAFVMGGNSKYINGDKKRSADARFVERVRVLAVRVAKSLILNVNLAMGAALTSSLAMLHRNNTLREAKIAEFEAKDGTRRIRGNIDQFTAQKRLTLKEQRDKNYVVDERPDRIDVDFSSHTVLATQHKQKLRVYKGAYAKGVKDSSKSFRNEDQESAVVLDTLDEFNLKFLLFLLKKALGIGRIQPTKKPTTKLVTEGEIETEEVGQATDAVPAEEVDDQGEADLDGYDEMEAFERQQRHEDELGEGRAIKKNEAKRAKESKAEQSLADLFGAEHKGQLSELLAPVLNILQGEGADTVVTTAFEVTHALLAINPPLPSVKTSGQVLFDVIAELFDRGGDIKPRAMRVISALVQHTYFNLSNDQAVWLTKVARGELIERTKILTMGLGLLQAVVNKHVEIAEVYELIDSVTELMMQRASSAPIRTRCVSIIAKFLTEYRLTTQKLQSHINMYVQNLQFPSVDGRMAMLELLGVLVFRLPQQVLRQECNVLFVPLVHCMSESPWAPCQEKAAVVLQSLVLNAGIDVVAKTISVWLESDSIKTREYAMQSVAVVLPVIPQLYGVDATEGALSTKEKAERFETIKAATEWIIPELQQALVYDHPLSKSKQQQIKEEIQRELMAAKKSRKGEASQDAELLVSRRIRAEKEMATWTFKFFSLRAVEALTKVAPAFCAYFGAKENAPIMVHVAKNLVTHSHPWVRSAATRVLATYVKGYVFDVTPYGNAGLKWHLATGSPATSPAYLALPAASTKGNITVAAPIEAVEEVIEEAKRSCKQLLVAVASSDVRDELHYGFKALDDPFREVLLEAVTALARIVSVGSQLVGKADALQSVWAQLKSMIEPVVSGRSIRGYLVRSATMVQLLPRLIRDLPFSRHGSGQPNMVSGIVDVPLLEGLLVPFVGICAESSEQSHSVAEYGLAAIESLKLTVGQYGPEFEGSLVEVQRGGDKKEKKRKAEKTESGMLAATVATPPERAAHAAVVLALSSITDELKEKQRMEKIQEMHEKNARKAERQEGYAAKMAAMTHKRSGGKKRSRYAQ